MSQSGSGKKEYETHFYMEFNNLVPTPSYKLFLITDAINHK